MIQVIHPVDTLNSLLRSRADDHYCFLDVRSELEFELTGIPGFVSAPILNDAERVQVGTCYKEKGQAAAIELGVELTRPVREERVHAWREHLGSRKNVIITCWRGGLRSRTACQWLELATGGTVAIHQVVGGTKALRQLLMHQFTKHQNFRVVSGPTGSGKSKLLAQLPAGNVVDLEQMAVHRGSAFGGYPHRCQPSQTRFENEIGMSLWPESRIRWVENESRCVGSVHLPDAVYSQIQLAPRVEILESLEFRVRTIYEEYVSGAATISGSLQATRDSLLESLMKIERALGGLRTKQVREMIIRAFEQGLEESAHAEWISLLMTEYYDPRYQRGRKNFGSPVEFRGTWQECLRFCEAYGDDGYGNN